MIVYTCEDTFEAMMTCIYDAWASKEGHQNIRLKTEPIGTMELFCEYRTVTSDPVKNPESRPFHPAEDFFHCLPYGLPLRLVGPSG